MRVLLTIHHHLDLDSGAPGTTLRLAEEYRRRGHEVEVWGFGERLPGLLPEQAKMLAYPLAVAGQLARMARHQRFDVIDASTGDAWLVAALRRGFPTGVRYALVVTRSHGLEHTMAARRRQEAAAGGEALSWRYPLYHGGYRLYEVVRSLRDADVALFLNHQDAAYAVESLGVAPERAEVVRNGISDVLVGLPPPQPSTGPGRIAVIGSYIERKGVSYAAAALNDWLPRHPGWSVTFLGTGVGRDEVFADYQPALHDRISVVPQYPNDDLARLLVGHHVHLFPTLSEGGPLSLIEAMACGLAPVASAVPGVVEAVRDGVTGLLVAPSDPDAIAGALDRLAADTATLDRMRLNAHRAAQSYGWSTVAGEQLALYERHLEARLTKEPAR